MLRFGLSLVAAATVAALTYGCSGPDPGNTVGGFGGGGTGQVSVFVSTGVGQVTTGSGLSDVAFKSGTRLRAHVIDGGGDARSFEGWFDAALGMDCTSTLVAGQPNRCMPPRVQSVVYVDAACTNAAAALPLEAPPYVIEPHSGSQTCDAYRAWKVGAETVAPTIYALGPGGVCAEVGVDASVRTLTPVPLDTFAELDVSNEHLLGTDWRQVENGPDGAFRVVTALESPNGAACEVFARPTDGNRPCLPSDRVRRRPEFSDGACGEPAIALGACEIAETQRIVDIDPDPCAIEAATLHLAGEIVPTVHTGEGCVATGQRGRRLGPVVQPQFTTFVYQEPRYGTEVVMLRDAASAVPVRSDGKFLRSYENNIPCTVARTAAGTLCVPTFAAHAHTFSDDACSVPVVKVLGQSCGLAPELAGEMGDDGGLVALRRVDAAYTGAIWSDASGACEQISEGGANWRGIETGDLPLDGYPELDDYIE